MSGSVRIVAVVGLLLLGLIGLIPPLKRPADSPGDLTGPFGSRAFLLSREYTFYTDYGSGEVVGKPWAEIDFGRLFAEALVIVAATGIVIVVLPKAKSRAA